MGISELAGLLKSSTIRSSSSVTMGSNQEMGTASGLYPNNLGVLNRGVSRALTQPERVLTSPCPLPQPILGYVHVFIMGMAFIYLFIYCIQSTFLMGSLGQE
jgi:hypothetical protein